MKSSPPHRALRFLRWFCREDCVEEVEGDLTEVFEMHYEQSPYKAKRKFIWTTIKYFRPEFIKVFSQHSNTTNMFRNDLKIAWRHLLKQKMYSSIKIGGFALGIAACLLIALFVKDELRYDQHYKAKGQIFRLIFEFEGHGAWVWFPAPTAKVLLSDFPEIQQTGRLLNSQLFGAGSNQIRISGNSQIFRETGFAYIDHSIIDILEVEFIKGSKQSALKNPHTILISEQKALKYFPDEDPIGKEIIIEPEVSNGDEEYVYTITGVFRNKQASHLQYEFFMTLSEEEFWPGELDSWNATNYHTYIKTSPQTNTEELEDKLNLLTKNYFAPAWIDAGDQGVEEESKKVSFKMQSVPDIHLRNGDIADGLHHGDIRFVWLFSAIAGFILLIAAINFINLSTAKSANRALEVGLRKTVGSTRNSLINQFLTESTLYSMLSFGLALLFTLLILPYFNTLSGKLLFIPWTEWWFMTTLFGACIILGIIAGLYPAIYLSSFKPINTLKGSLSKGSKSSVLRSSLVVFQFTTSVILIIATFVIYRQMSFILDKNLGFDKEQVVIIQGTNTLGNQLPTFKSELLGLSAVEHVSISNYLPVDGGRRDNNGFNKEGMRGMESAIIGQIWRVDADYIKTFGMKLTDGRDFNEDMISDSSSVIINQTMARKLGLGDPIGQRIENFNRTRTIVGVIEDFHFESMKGDIRPLCLVLGSSPTTTSVKIQAEDIAGVLTVIEEKWKKFSPNQKIRYSFLDDRFSLMYEDVQRMGKIFTSFAILAIIIACLGLFALSVFLVEQRTKEISIRLVLGASMESIFKLLTLNFVKLVFVSIIIAAPTSWYFMQHWLSDYAYRTEIGWNIFIVSSLLVLLIALLTISYQSLKAGLMSPVKNLRN